MRILVVDDEQRVASGIARALREESYAVDIARTGPEALDLSSATSYDVIVLDVRLPGLTGIDVCRELRRSGIETPILMLTARSLVAHRVEGLESGADDYLTKPFAIAELRARIRALIRRGIQNGASKLAFAELKLDRHRRRVTYGSTTVPLNSKEFAILEYMMLRAPEPVTRSEIIEHVWDRNYDSETNLVEVYVNRLRRKIDEDHEEKLIHTIRGVGYRLGYSE
jgi:DNA-binding response OmpR family regulator